MRQGNFENFDKVVFVDNYSGEGIDSAERAFTIRVQYRSDSRTLMDEEVDKVHETVIKRLADKLGARFR